MGIVWRCLLAQICYPIRSPDRDTSACLSNTGMRNYVSRDVILDRRIFHAFWTFHSSIYKISNLTKANRKQNTTLPNHTHLSSTTMSNNNKSNNGANVGETVGGAANFLTSTLGNTVGGLGRTVGNVTGAATRGVGDTVTAATGSTGRPIGDAVGNLGTGVQGGLDSISKGVEDAGQWKKQ
ncbi:hypothetical protein DER44DRAFT_678608 [Fusarium oxysporum]|nr:hypothetical protein DER44DRAFT_678608 [Fusarium oxysporum]